MHVQTKTAQTSSNATRKARVTDRAARGGAIHATTAARAPSRLPVQYPLDLGGQSIAHRQPAGGVGMSLTRVSVRVRADIERLDLGIAARLDRADDCVDVRLGIRAVAAPLDDQKE
jgi:hypothetical protein